MLTSQKPEIGDKEASRKLYACSKSKSIVETSEKLILMEIYVLKITNRHKMFKVNYEDTRTISLSLFWLLYHKF